MKHLLPIIVCLLVFISCDPLKPGYKDCEVDGHTNYQFNLPFYYTPNTDTLQLGDTLWIESTFSNQLYNEYNGKTVTLVDFDFGIIGGFDDLSTNPTGSNQNHNRKTNNIEKENAAISKYSSVEYAIT